MDRFANLADAGRRLGEVLGSAHLPTERVSERTLLPDLELVMEPPKTSLDGAIMLAVIPNGVPVAIAAAPAIRTKIIGLPVLRSDDGVSVDLDGLHTRLAEAGIGSLEQHAVLVVDDGVETGTLARAVAAALTPFDTRRLMLAVPVCAREERASLAGLYDAVFAVHSPFGRRALSWHFEDFDRIDDATAERLLAS